MSNDSSGEPKKPICQVWTDASYHDNFDQIGCAAFIQKTSDSKPYVLVATHDRAEAPNSTSAEFVAIAKVLDHLGPEIPVELHSDSFNALDDIDSIRWGEEGVRGKYPKEAIDVIGRHETLELVKVPHGHKKYEQVGIADDFAWYARKGKKGMIESRGKDRGVNIVYYNELDEIS